MMMKMTMTAMRSKMEVNSLGIKTVNRTDSRHVGIRELLLLLLNLMNQHMAVQVKVLMDGTEAVTSGVVQ